MGLKHFQKKKKPLRRRKKKDPFYSSKEWKDLRYQVLKESDGRCECCGKSKKDLREDGITKVKLTIDHIIPRSVDKTKELDRDNLQVLCEDCNEAKSNTDFSDWR